MPRAAVRSLRDRSIAALAVAAIHAGFLGLLLHAIPKSAPRPEAAREAIIPLLPAPPAKPAGRGKARRPSGTAAFTVPLALPPVIAAPDTRGLALALSSCAPENLGNAPPEIRAVCRRIGRMVLADNSVVGAHFDIHDGARWDRELLIKQGPLLLPCMDPNTSALMFLNLKSLLCVADMLANGYDPDKMQHYRK